MIRATGDQTGCVMDRYLILALLVVGCLSAPHGVIGQDVELRNNDKEGGSQARAIYSQRHLSPHRMMHFGKRLPRSLAPSIQVPLGLAYSQRGFDPENSGLSAQALKANAYVGSYPHLLTIELGNGQVLQELPQDISDLKRQARPTSVNFYEFERPGLSLKSQLDRLVALSLRDQNQQLQQEYRAFEVKRGLQPAQQDAERSSRLVSLEPVSADTDLENNSALAKSLPGAGELAEQAQPTSSTLDEQAVDVAQNVYQQQQQPRNIRSSMRVSLGSLSEDILRSHFPIDSRRLYANKKAEPKSVFMHFGRK